jgi:acyl-lipid omega-6 desaturase (Delta-12 desaturase)
MPQYVWSKHHKFHHAHNGDWDKYRGLYTTLSVDEYEALTETQQLLYRLKCSIVAAPIAGLIYVIFNPRFNWLKGSIGLLRPIAKGKIANPDQSIHALVASYETRYWQSPKRVWHMTWNNELRAPVPQDALQGCGNLRQRHAGDGPKQMRIFVVARDQALPSSPSP